MAGMASDLLLMHYLKFTIPIAVPLGLLSYLVLNRTHLLKVSVLAVTGFVATLLWDAYLIKTGVWNYPTETIMGPKLMGVPVEELLFSLVQITVVSILYSLANITLVHAKYLTTQYNPQLRIIRGKAAGVVLLVAGSISGLHLSSRGHDTYLGLILAWACPLVLLAWCKAGRFILTLPASAITFPILVPTVYVLLVDYLALSNGLWSIGNAARLGPRLFGSLSVQGAEQAVFVLLTNTLTVFALAALDQCLAVIDASPHLFADFSGTPPLSMLVKACLTRVEDLDRDRIDAISEADDRLRAKSRSFHFASIAFSGRFRLDLIMLYSFCRMADDLIDNSESEDEINSWNAKLIRYLGFFYDHEDNDAHLPNVDLDELNRFVDAEFPAPARSALRFLPAPILPGGPLYSLIDGFKMDAQFDMMKGTTAQFPIAGEADLRRYCYCVAGTIGELCNALIAHHCQGPAAAEAQPADGGPDLGATAVGMGMALQLVNIARDIATDAAMGRVYVPTAWLEAAGMGPEDVVGKPDSEAVQTFRQLLLDGAFGLYADMRPAMERLPRAARASMILVVESYMEIGRVLREAKEWRSEAGKATVPTDRRLWMAIKTMMTT